MRYCRGLAEASGVIFLLVCAFLYWESRTEEARKSPLEKEASTETDEGVLARRKIAPYWELKQQANALRSSDAIFPRNFQGVIESDMRGLSKGSYWIKSQGRFFNGTSVVVPADHRAVPGPERPMAFQVINVNEKLCEQLVSEHMKKAASALAAQEELKEFEPWYDGLIIVKRDDSFAMIQPKSVKESLFLEPKACQSVSSLIFLGL